jgi:hypothetical protein
MALIRVNSNTSWKASAPVFEAVLESAQKLITPINAQLAQTVRSVVESHLHWWSIADLTPDEYRSVMAAVLETEKTRPWERLVSRQEPPLGIAKRLTALSASLASDPRAM